MVKKNDIDNGFQVLLKDLEDILKGTDVVELIHDKKIKNEPKLVKALNDCMGHFSKEQAAIAKVVIKTLK